MKSKGNSQKPLFLRAIHGSNYQYSFNSTIGLMFVGVADVVDHQ